MNPGGKKRGFLSHSEQLAVQEIKSKQKISLSYRMHNSRGQDARVSHHSALTHAIAGQKT